MADPSFPPNTKFSPQTPKPEQPPKVVKPIAEGRRKKKSLGKQFTETFVGGDLKTTAHYVIFDVAIPSFRDLVADSAIQGIERLIFGETRGRRHMGPVRSRPGPVPGRVDYRGASAPAGPMRPGGGGGLPSRQRRTPAPEVTDFDDILIESRSKAEMVLERMGDIASQYGSVSVADLYSLVGEPTTHTDNTWGWTDLKGAHVSRERGSGLFELNLPDPAGF